MGTSEQLRTLHVDGDKPELLRVYNPTGSQLESTCVDGKIVKIFIEESNVQIGSNNTMNITNNTSNSGLSLRVMNRELEEEQIPNGRTRKQLHHKTDVCVRLRIYFHNEGKSTRLGDKDVADCRVKVKSVDCVPLNPEDSPAKAPYMHDVQPEQGEVFCLFRFFGPSARFHIKFSLERKMQIEGPLSYLKEHEIKWQEIAETSMTLQNKPLKKTNKRKPSSSDNPHPRPQRNAATQAMKCKEQVPAAL